MNKFNNVPADSETTVVQSQFTEIGGFDVKIEYWLWSSYKGSSAIFVSDEVKHLSDDQIIQLVKEGCNTDYVELGKARKEYVFATYSVKEIE